LGLLILDVEWRKILNGGSNVLYLAGEDSVLTFFFFLP
jgi:hypothetical protein